MTVCRYYAQGYCRFGDRCRFEHVKNNYNYNDSSNYNQRNVNYQGRNNREEAGYSDYNRYDNHQRNQRYESRNYYDEDNRSYSPERYTENYHPRYGGYDSRQQSRPKQVYEQTNRFNESNYGRNQQHYSNNQRENQNIHGQNRFRWLSNEYQKPSQPKGGHYDNEYTDDLYTTSTPKGKPSFSFKLPESEIKKATNTFFQINEQDQLYANMVKEDAKSWELGGQWPFTCYFPLPDKHAFPGFYDVSPEELRYAAYKAEENNSYNTYLQGVQNAVAQVNHQRSQLQIATPELLSTLKRIRKGEDLYTSSKRIDPIAQVIKSENVESMEPAPYSVSANSAAASFSFKVVSEADSSVNTSASNFSFKLPAATDLKTVSISADNGDTDVYTPLDKLTDEEKEQYSASTFVLGKIPTKPPPKALCT